MWYKPKKDMKLALNSQLQTVQILTNDDQVHGLRTPNEGINQIYLKIWAAVADKICFGRTYKFGSGSEFSAVQ